MSMSPRLLRPRQTSHPEAAAWAARVVANGGSVSGATLSAVSKFCTSVDSAGIRSIFYRVNLFCGGTSGTALGLNSCAVPLYRGPSSSGTQFGNTIDNPNLFGVGDYSTTGGLVGGSGKYLDTGFATNVLSAGNRHIGVYERVRPGATFQTMIGSEAITGIKEGFLLGYHNTTTTVAFGYGATAMTNLAATTTSIVGMWLGVNTPSTTGVIYRNGVQDSTGSATVATPEASNIFVFALNRASSSATNYYAGTLGGYSIGLAMTASQALAYYNAMQAFQAALNRSV